MYFLTSSVRKVLLEVIWRDDWRTRAFLDVIHFSNICCKQVQLRYKISHVHNPEELEILWKRNSVAKNAPGCVIWITNNQQNDKRLLFLQLRLYVGYYDSSFMCKWNIKPNITQQTYVLAFRILYLFSFLTPFNKSSAPCLTWPWGKIWLASHTKKKLALDRTLPITTTTISTAQKLLLSW